MPTAARSDMAMMVTCGLTPSDDGTAELMIRDHGQRVHQSSASPYLMQTARWQPMRDYAELALKGEFAQAAAVSDTLTGLRAVAKQWLHGAWHETHILPIAAIKAWSEMLGMAGGPVRTPLLQMREQDRRTMRADIEATGLLTRSREPAVA